MGEVGEGASRSDSVDSVAPFSAGVDVEASWGNSGDQHDAGVSDNRTGQGSDTGTDGGAMPLTPEHAEVCR